MNLHLKDFYISDEKFIISKYLTEYDISKANINILYSVGIIDDIEYDKYYNMDKLQREIAIGYMQKDKTISKALSDGFKYYRKLFIESNELVEDDIQSIRKDSFFIINKEPKNLIFDRVEFKRKDTFTSYYKLLNGRYDVYYSNDKTIIKGLSEEAVEKSKDFINALNFIFSQAEDDVAVSLGSTRDFYEKYVNLDLPLVFYREMDSNANFTFLGREYSTEMVNPEMLNMLDISCNRTIIGELYKYYFNYLF